MHVRSYRSLVGAGALATLVVIAGCDSGNTPASPPGRAPTGTATAVAPSIGATPSSSTAGSVQRVSSMPTATPHTVNVGGAQLTLPAGWTAAFEQPTNHSSNMMPMWCLSSTPLPSPVYVGQDCAAHFSTVPTDMLV